MKTLFFLFITTLTFGQGNLRAVVTHKDSIKTVREINVTQAGETPVTPTNEAIMVKADATKFDIFITAKLKGGTTPPPVPTVFVQAESGTITGAQKDPSTGGTTVCCITPGALLQYPTVLTGQTKLTVKYSRGSSGNGQVFLQIGAADTIPISLSLPSTGSWTVFKDVTFTFPAKTGTGIWIRSAQLGPSNFDSFTFTP